jgi:hypothetical protein
LIEDRIVHLGRHRDQSAESDSGALQASVDRLSALPVATLAVELMAKAYTGEPGPDDEPPWVDPFGHAPSAYEVANWLYLPREEELDTSQQLGRVLYGLVSESLQVLEHASLVRAQLDFGFQGALADAHMRYVLTRYGVSVRDAGAVEQALGGPGGR